MWNADVALGDTLTPTKAQVTYDGTIFWSRPGHVRPTCKFDGLENFPFDKLGCTMEFGSWSHSGLYWRPVPSGGNAVTVGASLTAGEIFNEFSVHKITSEEYVYPPFPAQPESDWPVILFHVRFQRAWEPYLRSFFARAILLNCIAFGCFWIPPKFTARLGLAMTSMLAAVAAELMISQRLPISEAWTFYGKVMVGSMLFTAVVILETICVTHLDFCTKNDLLPPWFHTLRGKYLNWSYERKCKKKDAADTHRSLTEGAPPENKDSKSNSSTGELRFAPSNQIKSTKSQVSTLSGSLHFRSGHSHEPDHGDIHSVFEEDDPDHHSVCSFHSQDIHPVNEMEREELSEIKQELAEALDESEAAQKRNTLQPAPYQDEMTPSTRLYKGVSSVSDSVTLPEEEPRHISMKSLALKAKALHQNDFKKGGRHLLQSAARADSLWKKLATKLPTLSDIEKKNSRYWKGVAAKVDEGCRLLVPLAYLAFISVAIHKAREMESL
mmetsp:Transcript_25807/g.60768  ORF Transcript_25807/g.60768 Transcript_25807/m.60768 type:complete len:496 (+) Transcript_25807:618-2105(+)